MLADRLKKGDKIVFVASSNKIDDTKRQFIEKGKEYLESKGFIVEFSEHAFEIDKYDISAGSAQMRADDINNAFEDDSVKAIWDIQGGNTANEILDLLDYDMIRKNPKIFIGKSDIDLLLLVLNAKTGLVTFHGPDPKYGRHIDIDIDYTEKWLERRLMDCEIGDIEKSGWSEGYGWKCVREGKVQGKLLGCNLSSILKLMGTKYQPDYEGAILFLETYKSDPKSVIYRLTQLKLLGVLDKIKGIVIGYNFMFDKRKGKDGKVIEFDDIVLNLTSSYDFPILSIDEFGHYCPNAILPIGGMVNMDAKSKKLEIIEPCLNT